jgi:hypothetical protein
MSECLPDFARYICQHEDGSWYGADDREGPWRPIPAPQSGLPWKAPPAAEDPSAAQPSPLSMAAQAVLDAADIQDLRDAIPIAAALRAVADQVVPEQLGLMHPIARSETHAIRAEILALAAELEGSNG